MAGRSWSRARRRRASDPRPSDGGGARDPHDPRLYSNFVSSIAEMISWSPSTPWGCRESSHARLHARSSLFSAIPLPYCAWDPSMVASSGWNTPTIHTDLMVGDCFGPPLRMPKVLGGSTMRNTGPHHAFTGRCSRCRVPKDNRTGDLERGVRDCRNSWRSFERRLFDRGVFGEFIGAVMDRNSASAKLEQDWGLR
jgi:hypothetical protein